MAAMVIEVPEDCKYLGVALGVAMLDTMAAVKRVPEFAQVTRGPMQFQVVP